MTTTKIGGAGVGAAAAARLGDDQSAEGAEARVAATMTATTAEGGDIIDIKGEKSEEQGRRDLNAMCDELFLVGHLWFFDDDRDDDAS